MTSNQFEIFGQVFTGEKVKLKRAKKELTKEQVLALSLFATLNGRHWKECLRNAWCDGDYGRYGARGIDGYLQQVRNHFGPGWLIRYKLPR